MTITLETVNALHDQTGAPVDECQAALDLAAGDAARAKELLTGGAPTFGEIARQAQAREAARHVIYLVGGERVGVVPTDQAVLMVTIAEDLEAQGEKMTQQAERLAALVRFATRLREAMAAAAGSAVRVDVDATEEAIAIFLLTQARARATLVDRTRYKHVCRVCGTSKLSNPEYENLMAHKRKKDALTRGLGVTFLSGGMASPIIMANSLFAFRKDKPMYACPRCNAVDTDQSVVVFCPQCKAEYDKPMLKKCPKCQYDFIKSVDVTDVWQPMDAVTVPAPSGEKLSEFRLDDEPTLLRFLPDGKHMLTASFARSVQLWDVGDEERGPRSLWTFSVGGVIKASNPIVAVSPDGRWVAVAKPQTPRVRLLRAADGVEVTSLAWSLSDGAGPNGLAFRADSQALIIANAYVEPWDLSGQRLGRLKLGAITLPSCVTCSPEGSYIAAAAGSITNNKLFLWRAADGAQLAKLSLPSGITDMAWHPTTPLLALGVGTTAVLMAIPAGTQTAKFQLDAQVTGVAISPDGNFLAAASKDHSARIFDLRTRTEVGRISRPTEVTAVAFAPDGRLAVGDDGNYVQFWSHPAGQL